MRNNIVLIQEVISSEIKTMWDELECILDGVDADFTGANGEEYYNEEGVSYMESAINEAEKIEEIITGMTQADMRAYEDDIKKENPNVRSVKFAEYCPLCLSEM